MNQIDAFGNQRAEKSESEQEEQKTDTEKVKSNMRNSSKIYYKITHSV